MFALTIGDRQDPLVVKIRGDDPTGIAAEEAWAIMRARDTGIPVPDVVYTGSYKHEGKRVGVLVQQLAQGTPLAELQHTLPPEARMEAYRRMGQTLGRLHQAQVGGFWKRHATGGWDFGTWEALMTNTVRDRKIEHKDQRGAGLSEPEAELLFSSIQRYADEFPCPNPVLCHGDFLPEHVYFDQDGQVSCVIDFGFYFGGDPVSDLAVTRMDVEPPEFDALIEGYCTAASLGDRFDLHLHLSLLTMQAGFLFHHMTVPGRPGVARYMEAVRSNLRWLEEHAG